jgi:predicted dehydrogenase
MNNEKTRCIVVGLGGLSGNMLRILAEKPWYQTAALVDVRPEALQKAGPQMGLGNDGLFTDFKQALAKAKADAVIINTPVEWHYPQVKAALEAGLHVLVAKPFASDFEQATELVELARKKKVTVSVGQQVRYNRHYRMVKRFIDSGKLGSIEAVFFFNSKPRPNALNLATAPQPALVEMSCHHFDSLFSLFPGRLPERIFCDGFRPSWSAYRGACMLNATIELSGNLHVLYHGGFSSQADMYELRLEGSLGVLRCRGFHMTNDTMAYEFASVEGRKWQSIDLDEGAPAVDGFVPLLEAWRDYMHGGAEPPFSGRNNLPIFALLTAGINSVESGKPVEIASNPRYQIAFK